MQNVLYFTHVLQTAWIMAMGYLRRRSPTCKGLEGKDCHRTHLAHAGKRFSYYYDCAKGCYITLGHMEVPKTSLL